MSVKYSFPRRSSNTIHFSGYFNDNSSTSHYKSECCRAGIEHKPSKNSTALGYFLPAKLYLVTSDATHTTAYTDRTIGT